MNYRRSTLRVRVAAASGIFIAVAASGIVAASSRNDDSPAGSYETEVRSAGQVAALADGEVTLDEYTAAFSNFERCMYLAGQPLKAVEFQSPSQEFSYRIDVAADDSCYNKHFYATDREWQLHGVDKPVAPKNIAEAELQQMCENNATAEEFQLAPELVAGLCRSYGVAWTP